MRAAALIQRTNSICCPSLGGMAVRVLEAALVAVVYCLYGVCHCCATSINSSYLEEQHTQPWICWKQLKTTLTVCSCSQNSSSHQLPYKYQRRKTIHYTAYFLPKRWQACNSSANSSQLDLTPQSATTSRCSSARALSVHAALGDTPEDLGFLLKILVQRHLRRILRTYFLIYHI